MSQQSATTKKPLMQNFSNFVKKTKEKISTLFKKKEKAAAKTVTVNQNEKILMPTPTENKHIFKIEEDEEAKEYSYHLNDPDSDEDDDYEEEESDEEKKKAHKESHKESNKETQKVGNTLVNSTTNTSAPTTTFEDKNVASDFSEEDYDVQNISHRIYYKGSYVDLGDVTTTKFVKIKKKSNLLSIIGFGKKNNLERNYLAMIDEHYIYFMKDVPFNAENKELRRIGNKFSIKLLENTIIDTENDTGDSFSNGKIKITLQFVKSINTQDLISKVLYIDDKSADKFVSLFNSAISRLNIQLADEDGSEEEEETD